jgi:hypothetical protein
MSWEQLLQASQTNRDARRQAETQPPSACPQCGALLDANGRNERNCPLGHYQWPRDGRVL